MGEKGQDGHLEQKTWNFVLASASPRRREILTAGGLSHMVRPADIDESVFDGTMPQLMVQLLAASKAAKAAESDNEVILGADTVVVSGGRILGKPASEEEAAEMLSTLSGKTHFVYTGIAILCTKDGRMRTHCAEAKVTFRTLSAKEIAAYVATGEPMDKAGAYGIQGQGGKLVAEMAGDLQTVIGLPLAEVKRLLREMNLE